MPSLMDIPRDPERRQRLIADCAATLHDEVHKKTGVVAFAVKKAYDGVSHLEHGRLIENVFDKLLDEFAEAMEPFYQDYRRTAAGDGTSFEAYVEANAEAVSKALLVVTDRERDRVDSRILVLAYNSLRGTAMRLVTDSVPAVGAMLARHVDEAAAAAAPPTAATAD